MSSKSLFAHSIKKFESFVKSREEYFSNQWVSLGFKAHHERELCLVGDRVGGRVTQELSHQQKVCPFHGLTLAKDPEVGLQFLVDLFGLAIGLRMVGSGEGDIIFKKVSQLLCKGRGKLWTMVRDYFVVETKAGEDMFEKQGNNTGGIDGFATRDENHPLYKPMVNHDQNRVKTGREWKIHNHVARDLLERAGGGRQDRAEPRDSWMSVNLVGLAGSAASHKSTDKGG